VFARLVGVVVVELRSLVPREVPGLCVLVDGGVREDEGEVYLVWYG
jgi:hypothetical protein